MEEVIQEILTALRGMWRRRWIGLAVAWAVAVVGAIVLLRIPDRYEATARVFVDTQTVLKPLMSGLAVQPNVDEQISMLARTLIARPNIEKIMRSADLDVTVKTQIETDRLVDTLISRIKFIGSGRENIYSISYQDESPGSRQARCAGPAVAVRRVGRRQQAPRCRGRTSLYRRADQGLREEARVHRRADQELREEAEEAESRVKDFKMKNLRLHRRRGSGLLQSHERAVRRKCRERGSNSARPRSRAMRSSASWSVKNRYIAARATASVGRRFDLRVRRAYRGSDAG